MNRILFVVLAAAAVTMSMPLAAADHGLNAVYASTDGSFQAVATYVTGFGTSQTFNFDVGGHLPTPFPNVPAGDRCVGFGSIETGFSGSCASGKTFSVGGTGVFHGYPNFVPEVNQGIAISYGGVSSTGVEISAPDIGRPL